MNCVHCGKKFTCGCQKAKAADGKVVHKTCVATYNAKNGKVFRPNAKNGVIRKNERINKYDRARRINH